MSIPECTTFLSSSYYIWWNEKYKALWLQTELQRLSQEKAPVFKLQAELAGLCVCVCLFLSFINNHFYLKERLTDELGLFRLGCLADVFWERNQWACHFVENSWKVFVANNTIGAFWAKIRFLGKYLSATVSLTASQYLNFFSDEIGDDINEYNTLFNKVCQHSEDLPNSVEQ